MCRRALIALAAALLLLGPAAGARAGMLAPGQSLTIATSDFVEPRGVLVAEQELPFTLRYTPVVVSAAPGDSGAGTLFGSVYRDPFDQTLTFVYNAQLNDGAPIGAARLMVDGFRGVQTDVTARLAGADAARVSRLADPLPGIEAASYAGPTGGTPLLVVRTNATSFDAAGAATFAADFPVGIAPFPLTGTADIAGVFQPAAGPASAVPLPRALSTSVAAFAACGAASLLRRSRARRA
jgi:hypothetical protein